jgi:hypothetical protein
MIERFERRKRWCEEALRVAEATPDAYQHALDLLKNP